MLLIIRLCQANVLYDNKVSVEGVFKHQMLSKLQTFPTQERKILIFHKEYFCDFMGLCFLAEISCPDLVKPTNGKKNGSDFTYQSVVNFSCNEGYTLKGSQQRTCQANKSWTGETTTCSGKAE